MTAIGIVPARWGSTRFPGKPLVPIAGVPLVQRVYWRARGARSLSRVLVATDDHRIAEVCMGFGAPVVMTSPHHPSGTDRVAEAAAGSDADVIVNIQGDEPLIEPRVLDRLVAALDVDREAVIATAAHPLEEGALEDPHRVKVAVDRHRRALAFSRATPPGTPAEGVAVLQHVGVYAYRRQALHRFVELPSTLAERRERLEQLRALDNGLPIAVVVLADWRSAAVDVPADVARVEAIIAQAEGHV